MRLSCNRRGLIDAFAAVSGVVPTRSPKPVLQNALMTVAGDGAFMIATDLEVAVTRRVLGVQTDFSGSFLLPSARFGQILKASQADEIEIDVDDGEGRVRVKAGRSRYTLATDNQQDFPRPPERAEGFSQTLATGDLRKLIGLTAFATDLESARYALGGCLVEPTDSGLAFVATDGRRLAKMETRVTDADDEPDDGNTHVIPVKALRLIERNLGADDEPVKLSLTTTAATIETEGALIYTRLVEGRFPRYQDIFPDPSAFRLRVQADALAAAVAQAAITTSDESRGVDFHLAPGSLTLQGRAAETGESRVELPIEYDGAETTVSLDPRFVAEPLKAIGPVEIAIDFGDGENAAVIKAGDDYTYVVMPIARRE